MELVYLWVEEYKNIKSQGFNFSPKFNCHYDEENNELTIDENDDYIENFFGDNINVTAIVGKNGSGKSSLLEVLEEIENFKDINHMLISKIEEKIYCRYSLANEPSVKTDIEIICEQGDDIFLDQNGNYPFIHVGWLAYDGSNNDNLSKQHQPLNWGIFGSMKNSSRDIRFFFPKYTTLYRNHKDHIDKLKDICSFNTIKVKLKKRTANELNWLKDTSATVEENDMNKLPFSQNRKIIEEIIDLVGGAQENLLARDGVNSILYHKKDMYCGIPIYTQLTINIFIGFVELFLKKSGKLSLNKMLNDVLISHANRINKSKQRLTKDDILSIINEINNKDEVDFFKDNEPTVKSYIEAVDFLYSHVNSFKHDTKYGYCFDVKIEDINDSMFDHFQRLYTMSDDNDISFVNKEDSFRIIELDLIDSNTGVHYGEISSGERQFLNYSIDLLIQMNNYLYPGKKIVLLGDEIDNSLHPVWKKQVLKRTIDILNTVNTSNIHFILTTHSPFLLSDIPKQNIIFLDTYREKDKEVKDGIQKVGNCKVLKHDEVMDKKQTFGQNIHTLLSDSFFMEDGLMGEFARGKINEIIRFHNLTKKNRHKSCLQKIYDKREKGFRQTQSIIGDPYLQQVLENHLLEIDKFFDKKIAKAKLKVRLEKQLAELEDD